MSEETVTQKGAGAMSRADFDAVPLRKWDAETTCRAFVILPANDGEELHDSGFRRMELVALDEHDMPICRTGGGDVVHLDGIGGYGHRWLENHGTVPKLVVPSAWSVDCLPASGLLRLFPRGSVTIAAALSSMEVYAVEKSA